MVAGHAKKKPELSQASILVLVKVHRLTDHQPDLMIQAQAGLERSSNHEAGVFGMERDPCGTRVKRGRHDKRVKKEALMGRIANAHEIFGEKIVSGASAGQGGSPGRKPKGARSDASAGNQRAC